MSALLECGHPPSEHGAHTTGYGTDNTGARHCWECCAAHDLAAMRERGKVTLYLSQEWAAMQSNVGPDRVRHHYVSNWPGTLKMRAYVRKGRHNIAGTRYDAWFTDVDGRQWHGVQYGDWTQIVHCKRMKAA